jgi:hypothetical protein
MDYQQKMVAAYHAEAARLFKAAAARKIRMDSAFTAEKRAAYCELEEKLGAWNMDKIAYILMQDVDPIEKLAFLGALGGMLGRLAGRLGLSAAGGAVEGAVAKGVAGAAAKGVAGAAEGAAAKAVPSWFSGMAAKRGLTAMEGGQLYGKMQQMGPMEFAKQRMFRKAVDAPMLNAGGSMISPAVAAAKKKSGLWPEVRSNLLMGGAMGLTQRLLEKPDENKQVVYGY